MKVFPVAGRLVRDPATGREVTDPAGTEVPDNDPFWLRRLADGDVSAQPQTADNASQGAK
ncbi:Protein of unknown function [Noviherbaspirillum humi]|uniref:DUF2635 domain-containing protein n=1 Tax=Noviherbaspirillum humi TaxID=1688639 RepID=A0A239LF71_9BURK|nr:DUF2635 domain-containing protein [Noviherbaspirillum humi]SNT28950.1 Protein of unknown function [Noviherbaspirillum humi]